MLKYERKKSALFMPDAKGIWRCLQTNTDFVRLTEVLADILNRYELNFPDGTHFARVKRYASGKCTEIEYRAYDALRIELTFNIFDVL